MSATAPENQSTEGGTISILAQLLAGAFMSRAEGPRELRKVVGKVREWLGEKTPDFFHQMGGVQICLAMACADEVVLGNLSDATKKTLAALPAEEKVIAEVIHARITGKFEGNEGRWIPALWRMRKLAEEYLAFSPSQISKAEAAGVARRLFVEVAKIMKQHILQTLS